MMRRSTAEQHKDIAATQKRWASLAFRESKDNLRQARRFSTMGKRVEAREYKQEFDWDYFWYVRRMHDANEHRKRIGKEPYRIKPNPLKHRRL